MGYVFIEIDMRNDFADDPRAVLPVPGTYAIVGKMRVLEEKADTVVEVYDSHCEDDAVSQEEFKTFPPHCIPGTWGHERIPGLYSPTKPGAYVKMAKNTYDAWKGMDGDACAERSLDAFETIIKDSERIVVGGVVTGICVKAFVEGMISRGYAKKTTVIADCVANLEGTEGILKTVKLFSEWTKDGVLVQAFEDFVKENF